MEDAAWVADFAERPPYAVRWGAWTGLEFVTVGMHVRPDNVEAELDQLGAVAAGYSAAGDHVVVLGDFNADCQCVTSAIVPFGIVCFLGGGD
jgi:endonuclease/exonuclease/phosphatase family metal-dependent hydrolase